MLDWLFGKKLKFSGYAFFVYSNPRAAAQWWMDKFEATRIEVPENDDPLPSDTALGAANGLSIMYSSLSEVQAAKLGRESDLHPLIECSDIDLALQYFQERGVLPGAIQEGRGMRYFEIHDVEGNAIEIIQYV
jgi:hypothetical protein